MLGVWQPVLLPSFFPGRLDEDSHQLSCPPLPAGSCTSEKHLMPFWHIHGAVCSVDLLWRPQALGEAPLREFVCNS